MPASSRTIISVGGETVYAAAASIATKVAQLPLAYDTSREYLCNWGTNSPPAASEEVAWKAAYVTIIDALTAHDPSVKIYLAKPWQRGYDTECARMAGWIDDLVALYPGVAFVGINENVTIKAGDNGVTNTTDGVHYSAAGNTAAAAAWKAIIQP